MVGKNLRSENKSAIVPQFSFLLLGFVWPPTTGQLPGGGVFLSFPSPMSFRTSISSNSSSSSRLYFPSSLDRSQSGQYRLPAVLGGPSRISDETASEHSSGKLLLSCPIQPASRDQIPFVVLGVSMGEDSVVVQV